MSAITEEQMESALKAFGELDKPEMSENEVELSSVSAKEVLVGMMAKLAGKKMDINIESEACSFKGLLLAITARGVSFLDRSSGQDHYYNIQEASSLPEDAIEMLCGFVSGDPDIRIYQWS